MDKADRSVDPDAPKFELVQLTNDEMQDCLQDRNCFEVATVGNQAFALIQVKPEFQDVQSASSLYGAVAIPILTAC